MRDESEVRKKLGEARYRYLRKYLRPRPCNCVHNHAHDTGEGTVRLCMLGSDDPENWPGNICDTVENVRTCPFYRNRYDKDELKAKFDTVLEDPDVLYNEYRDIAMLKWILEEEPPALTWWQKFKLWFVGS